ncbi:phage antirepressor KilAC domain-containing protein [Clostridium sp.]|uniref:phage antirepressor KilAC domain-containing protein n=1 Tax=Clostridium sp. TaxID=1506 RepID=UPI0032170FA2
MNKLTVIDQRELLNKDFKIYGTIDNPLFLAKDVADWIEHSQADVMIKKVDDEEKVLNSIHTLGGNQNAWFLTEDGFYEVLMQSRKPIAKKFKKEVKKILKDVRKNGMYATDELLDNPDLLIQVATQLKKEREEKRLLQLKIQEDKPKVLFAEALEVSDNTILIGELAKLLRQNGVDVGQNRLFERLRSEGYLIKKKGESYNLPTQRAMDQELFQIKTRTINNTDGSIRTTRTTKITGKGQVYFINKFKGDL